MPMQEQCSHDFVLSFSKGLSLYRKLSDHCSLAGSHFTGSVQLSWGKGRTWTRAELLWLFSISRMTAAQAFMSAVSFFASALSKRDKTLCSSWLR